ncbi:hypothetical protein [Rhizobium leguminosarum]|uniref:hypothetical protein n=1 Tax=Rhizobium leguminosarum TaxID=384 RepID=UPI0010318719|nr:hypothetical protein [Rhizobium leguminosarum]TAY88086.1 hypothetical protein ELH83_09780 [Rhizobium leguminosarum]
MAVFILELSHSSHEIHNERGLFHLLGSLVGCVKVPKDDVLFHRIQIAHLVEGLQDPDRGLSCARLAGRQFIEGVMLALHFALRCLLSMVDRSARQDKTRGGILGVSVIL